MLGALNLVSDRTHAFTERDEAMLLQFAAHVAQALVNARLFDSRQEYTRTLETLAEVGREMSAILELDELLTRVAHLVKRLIDYRTFGIALLSDAGDMLEMKTAISYGDATTMAPIKLGVGLVGYAALHKEPVLVPDVSKDSRYVNAVSDVRSELVIPLLLKDRCVGVFDLESPGARRLRQEARGTADAARVAGGGRDRECAVVRFATQQRSPPRKRSALCAAGAARVAAAGAPEEAEGR